MTKRKPIDTGARADVVESLRLMRAWLAANDSADVCRAWAAVVPTERMPRCPVRTRLLAFVLPGNPKGLHDLSMISTPAYSLRWLDTVIAHDTAELKARGVL